MVLSVRFSALALVTFNLAIAGCARSGSGALDEETQGQLTKASDDAANALAGVQTNAGAIDELGTRVDAVEDLGDRVTAVEGAVADVAQDVADLDSRVDAITWPPRDNDVVVDDAEAAGFPAGVVANAEQGFSYVNTRLGLQSGRIDDVESDIANVSSQVSMIGDSFLTNIETTVTNVVQEQVNSGAITVDADLSFDPGAGVDPRADAADTYPEYGAATTLEDAIRSLRWANQVKFTPPDANTRLGALARNYVQEAIVALDRDVYDVIGGNVAIDLNAGATVDGSPIDGYIQDAVIGDATYLAQLFNTTEFATAVANIVSTGGIGTVAAGAVTVDPANLAATGYDNAQAALESLYTRSGVNATDIASLTTTVNNLLTGVATLAAAGITFDNTNHGALVLGNTNANVQTAVEDLYEYAQQLQAQIAAIGAGGVSTDAANVTYGQNNQATVRGALDELYTVVTTTQAIIGNGNYVTDGQLVNDAVLDLDTALFAVETLADDLDTRVTVLEAQVQTNTTNIATNTASIATNAADIATNEAGIATNAAAIAALRAGDDTTFNAFLDTQIQAAVNALVQNRIQPLEDAVAQLQNARNAYILGVSAQASTGAFNFGGKQGVAAATEMCRASFADETNAHLCSLSEINNALATSSYDDTNLAAWDNVATWTITGVHALYSGGAYNTTGDYNPAADSLSTSCNNFLYNSADVAKGTTVRVDIDFNSFGVGGAGRVGDAFRVQPGVACSTSLPVLCCR